jgi:hypothetical protein
LRPLAAYIPVKQAIDIDPIASGAHPVDELRRIATAEV